MNEIEVLEDLTVKKEEKNFKTGDFFREADSMMKFLKSDTTN